MAKNNCHIETGSCLLAASVTDAAGKLVHNNPVYVTAGVGDAKSAKVRDTGTDYSAKNFGGQQCGGNQIGETTEKWSTITGNFCLVDWAFMGATCGNPVVLDADGNVVGYQELSKTSGGACSPTRKPRVSLLIVRASATGDAGIVDDSGGATACTGHFFPLTWDWFWDTPDFTDTRAMVPFTTTAYSNINANAGLLNLWPAGDTPDTIDPDAFHAPAFLDCSALPSPNCDTPLSHPAPAVRGG